MDIFCQIIYLELGKKITRFREYLNICQADMSEIIKVSQSQYAKYELGKQRISVCQLLRICKRFKLSLNFFFSELDSYSKQDTRIVDCLKLARKKERRDSIFPRTYERNPVQPSFHKDHELKSE